MTIRIDSKITGYKVVEKEKPGESSMTATDTKEIPEPEIAAEAAAGAEIIQMHEKLERPEMLLGSTYKVKTPLSEHALYITINDIVLNEDTEHEMRRPYEIFINSKNMDHFQWIVALTRIISAIFRKGGDVTFLVDELRSVFDPRGGYYKKGGRYKPSLVAEIGDAIECHMKMIGMIEDDQLDEHQRAALDAKRREYDARYNHAHGKADADAFPPNAQLCMKCHTRAMISMDGCLTCLNCGDSKCG